MSLCECGCGQEAKPGRRFINGHNRRGVPRSPETCAKISRTLTGIPKPPRTAEHCTALSGASIGVSKSPEHNAAISKAKTGIPLSPEHIAAIRESDATKVHIETMIGGDDLVTHHYIYDHADLSLNTIQMTRKDHGKLHALLRKLGYKVPHINR